MALSLVTDIRNKDSWGGRFVSFALYTGPASYTAGGEAPNNVGAIGAVERVLPFTISDGTNIRLVHQNPSTGKLQVFIPSTGVGVAGGVDLSTYTGNATVLGR